MFETDRSSGPEILVRPVDASRECLFFLLNRMFDPETKCADPGATCSRIEDTIRFLTRNLEREERLMKETGYPGFAAHKQAHETLLRELERMNRNLVCGRYDNALVADFLTEWTKSHIAGFDMPFGDFLRERGSEPVQAQRS